MLYKSLVLLTIIAVQLQSLYAQKCGPLTPDGDCYICAPSADHRCTDAAPPRICIETTSVIKETDCEKSETPITCHCKTNMKKETTPKTIKSAETHKAKSSKSKASITKSTHSKAGKKVEIEKKTFYVVAAHGGHVGNKDRKELTTIPWDSKFPVSIFSMPYSKCPMSLKDAKGINTYKKLLHGMVPKVTNRYTKGDQIPDFVFGGDAGFEHLSGVYKVVVTHVAGRPEELIHVSESLIFEIHPKTEQEPIKLTDLVHFFESKRGRPHEIYWLCCTVYLGENPYKQYTKVASLPLIMKKGTFVEERRQSILQRCEDRMRESVIQINNVLDHCEAYSEKNHEQTRRLARYWKKIEEQMSIISDIFHKERGLVYNGCRLADDFKYVTGTCHQMIREICPHFYGARYYYGDDMDYERVLSEDRDKTSRLLKLEREWLESELAHTDV